MERSQENRRPRGHRRRLPPCRGRHSTRLEPSGRLKSSCQGYHGLETAQGTLSIETAHPDTSPPTMARGPYSNHTPTGPTRGRVASTPPGWEPWVVRTTSPGPCGGSGPTPGYTQDRQTPRPAKEKGSGVPLSPWQDTVEGSRTFPGGHPKGSRLPRCTTRLPRRPSTPRERTTGGGDQRRRRVGRPPSSGTDPAATPSHHPTDSAPAVSHTGPSGAKSPPTHQTFTARSRTRRG